MPSKRRPKRAKDPKRIKPRLFRRRWFQLFFAGGCVLFLIGLLALYLILAPHKKAAAEFDLAEIEQLEIPSRIYDRRGVEIGQIKVENRRPVKLDQVPYHLIQALTAAEDSRFFQHGGVDYMGIARAMLRNIRAGQMSQGASTITQQLANQTFDMKKEKDIGRKLTEAFLAVRIEEKYTKSEILEHYLNRIYFGSGYFGIEAAARGYFGKSASGLDIAESATLCGLIKSPTRLSPKLNPKDSRRERDYVLKRMNIEGMITDSQLAEFKAKPIELSETSDQENSYVYEIIRQQVIDQLGFERAGGGGFKIYTTIDNEVQTAARESMLRNLAATENHPEFKHRSYEKFQEAKDLRDPLSGKQQEGGTLDPDYLQGALLMVENRSGGIVAIVGGRNFADSQFNRALQARRPPGTAFKPLVYAAAFNEASFPGTLVKDAPIDNRSVAIGGNTGILGEWGNESMERRPYLGDIPAREALVHSLNSASVRLGKKIGLQKVIELAGKAGIESPIEDLTKSFLGSSGVRLDELCRAFTIFPNGGSRPSSLHIIESISNSKGETKFEAAKAEQVPVIDEIAAYQVHSCLAESIQRGTARDALKSYGLRDPHAAGKTGTAYNHTDLWFIGYNNEITCGVWAGFDDPKSIYRGAFGNRTALPIWVDAMNASAAGFPSQALPFPEGAQTVEICKKSGRRATDACYEEDPNEEDGTRRIIRSTYREILRSNIEFQHYCNYHSGGKEPGLDPAIPAIAALNPAGSPLAPRSGAAAIAVRSPALVGSNDPYNSLQPILKARAADDREEVRRATPVSPVSSDIGTLPVRLERPKPLVIPQIE